MRVRGSITKRGRESWALRVSAGFDPVTGKRRRIFRTVRGAKREAETELARLIHAVETGTETMAERMTVAAYLDRWLTHARSRVRRNTWIRYEQLLRVHVTPRMGSVRLERLRPSHVQGILDAMGEAGQSPRSVEQCYRVLHAALRQARRWQLIASNPAEAVSPPRPSRPHLSVPDAPGLARIIEGAKSTPWEAPIALACLTGLRRGELLGLRWDAVDLERGRLRVLGSLQRVDRLLTVLEPKTDRARREIALPPTASEVLRRQRVEQNARRLALGEAWEDSGLVFDRGDGGPLNPDSLSHALVRIADRVGLPGVRFHDLRHGYATALLSQGVHPAIASAVLGHASPAFTMSVYQHVLDGMTSPAAEAIERALSGGN